MACCFCFSHLGRCLPEDLAVTHRSAVGGFATLQFLGPRSALPDLELNQMLLFVGGGRQEAICSSQVASGPQPLEVLPPALTGKVANSEYQLSFPFRIAEITFTGGFFRGCSAFPGYPGLLVRRWRRSRGCLFISVEAVIFKIRTVLMFRGIFVASRDLN